MEEFVLFLRAALPWIAMGLLLAVFAVRSAGRKHREERAEDYGSEGMCLGMCFGTAIGTSLGNNTGLGMCLGMLLGLAVGSSIYKEKRHGDDREQDR